jgi:hypothetical protein
MRRCRATPLSPLRTSYGHLGYCRSEKPRCSLRHLGRGAEIHLRWMQLGHGGRYLWR